MANANSVPAAIFLPLGQWTLAQDARHCDLYAQHIGSMNTLITLAMSAQTRRNIPAEDLDRRVAYLCGPSQD